MATFEDAMEDLGLARAEEVASDGRSHRSFSHDMPAKVMPILQGPGGEATNMWQNAIREGLFEDSDFDSVKRLDPLSNGNLHRQNRQVRDVIGALLEGDPRYDPTQPGYRGGQRKRPELALPPDHRISKNGILLPPGMVTKRWEPGATAQRPAAQHSALPSGAATQEWEPKAQPRARPATPSLSPPAMVTPKSRPMEENIVPESRHVAHPTQPPNGIVKSNQAHVANGPLVSVPSQPVPRQDTALNTTNKTQSKPVSRPLVSMPNRPVPDASLFLKMNNHFASLPTSLKSDRSDQPASQKLPEEIIFSCVASNQIIVKGATKSTPTSIFVLRQGSNIPLVRCQAEEDHRILFEECLDSFLLPIQHNSTVFLRYGPTFEELKSKQLKFTNTSAADAFAKQFRQLAKQFQFTATEADQKHTRLTLAMAQTAQLDPKVDVESSPTSADEVCDQVVADAEQHKALLDVAMIEAVDTNHNIHLPQAQACIQFLTGLKAAEIAEMAGKVQELEGYLNGYYGPVAEGIPILKSATLQISLLYLLPIGSFDDLPHEEKKRALALVYKGVLKAYEQL